VCVEIGADWLIDDNPEHCLSAIEHGLNTILFGDYGWQYKAPEHLYRCKNWEEVERLLDEKFARK
jgi:5'(3')-deoxyribonucleotidase